MIDLKRMTHVLALHEARSFVKAAEKLGITQSALSRSIQSIEEEYSFRLFERGRGDVIPTAAALALIPEATRVLSDAKAFDRALRTVGRAESGTVAFGMGPIASIVLMPRLLIRMLKERPGICAGPIVEGGPEIVRKTLADELEFCCSADVMLPAHDRLETIPIMRLPLALIVRAGHPLLRGDSALEDFPLVGGSSAPNEIPYQPRIQCDNNSAIKAVALQSDCVWLTAPASARDEIAAGSLVVLPHKFATADQEIRIVLIRHRGRTLSPAAHYLERTIRKLAMEY